MAALYFDCDHNAYSEEDLYKALVEVGVKDCEHLFIHSDIMFGRLACNIKRNELMQLLWGILEDLKVKSIIVPTFTYSFCNNEDYDVMNSKTTMGTFNEFIRKREGRYRTHDPLLSISVSENYKKYFQKCGCGAHSLGIGSGLDMLHHLDGVKFLFMGARMGNCFTYLHYIEKIMDVPYRFDLPFQGNIIYEDGHIEKKTQYMHTACGGVKPAEFYYFEDELVDRKLLLRYKYADSQVSAIDEKIVYQEIKNKILNNINYFLEKPFSEADLTHVYTKTQEKGKITHC